MRKNIFSFIVLMALLLSLFPAGAQAAPQAAGTPSLPILFGVYPSDSLQSTIGEITAMNTWLTSNSASGVTFAGDFMSLTLNPAWNVPNELNAAWNNGFVPYVNLMPSESWEGGYYDANCDTTVEIAAGSCDAKIAAWANYFKSWAGSSKFAYLAPLPEVNGDWINYASDGPTFIQAYLRIRQIFNAQGVPASAVRWVFVPNGWHNPAYPWKAFENYYPGDANVDVVGFSAYNYGNCPTVWAKWDTFETAMEPYLVRMRAMAPSKPIFISQTGTVGNAVNPSDPTQTKSAWVLDTFGKLANYPAVRAILYFHRIKPEPTLGNCPTGADYRLYYGGSSGEAGFLSIMQDSRFGKWATNNSNWGSVAFANLTYVFADVQPSHPFSGVPNIWYYDAVHTLYNEGITGGCATGPLRYCPNNPVTRGQMAVFLEKSINGSGFTPPPATGSIFNDVPETHWAAAWIEQLYTDGITGGCGNGNYCPENPVTRAQMAVFILKAKYGADYTPPPLDYTGSGFADVPATNIFAPWIKQLAAEGITSGCGNGNYCPNNPVTRAQMAVFLVSAFNLP